MATQKLTESRVLKAQAEEKVYMLWDSVVPGFHLRVYPTGVKSYAVRFQRHNGSKVVATIGSVSVHTLDDAREQARKLREMHDQGKDARAFVQGERKAKTVSDLVNRWKEEKYRGKLKPSSQRSYDSIIAVHILPAIGTRLVRDLTHQDISDLYEKVRETHPVGANRMITVLSRLFNIAELLPGFRSPGTNPCLRFPKGAELSSDRVLNAIELARLEKGMTALEAKGKLDTIAADLLRFLACSGLRTGEALNLAWTDIDLDANTMTIRDHKTSKKNGPKKLPLNPALLKILGRRSTTRLGVKLVFPGLERLDKKTGKKVIGPIGGLRKMWLRVAEECALEDVTPHDLRRTFMTASVELGYPPAIGKTLLGQSIDKITDIYVRLSMDGILRQASDATSSWISAAMSGKPVKSGKKVGKAKKQA